MQHLNRAQQDIYSCILAKPEVVSRFLTFSAMLEGHLDEVERPDLEKTDPFGLPAIREGAPTEPVDSETAAAAIAIAWLEMIARAIMEQEEFSPLLFDEDGLAVFSDTSSVFEVVRACGIAPAVARRAFKRARGDARLAPPEAMRILGLIGAIKRPKRQLPSKSRIVATPVGLEPNELARAIGGSITYSLFVRKDGYEAVRVRKAKTAFITDTSGAPLEILSEADVDVITDFGFSLVPHESVHGEAITHFIDFLSRERRGRKDRVYTCTYRKLIHRPFAA